MRTPLRAIRSSSPSTREKSLGWATYGDFRDTQRWPGYRYTVEHSIHVSEAHWPHGVGRALLDELMTRAAAAGKRVMIAAIDTTNGRSIAFHHQLGFEEVGRLPRHSISF